jgi:hypothetical protein
MWKTDEEIFMFGKRFKEIDRGKMGIKSVKKKCEPPY